MSSLEAKNIRNARLLDILEARRTHREFVEQPVDPSDLDVLRSSIELAPSAGNSRPWRIVDVSTAPDLAIFEGLFREAEKAYLDSADLETKAKYQELRLGRISNAPVQWAFFCQSDTRLGRGLGVKTMPEAAAHSTACAIHTLSLCAAAMELGVSWNTTFSSDAVIRACGLPENWRFVALVGIGKPTKKLQRPFLAEGGWSSNEKSQTFFRDLKAARVSN